MTELPDKLLDLIDDAATDAELWTSALIQIADTTHSVGGFVFGIENKARLVAFLYNGGLSEEGYRVYQERHIVNPWSAHMNHSPVGKIVRSDEILSVVELQRLAFLMRFCALRASLTMP